MWKLFVDDERFPPNDGGNWSIARDICDVESLIVSKGSPEFISFDHDLGDHTPTGFDIAKQLVEWDMDHPNLFKFPHNFDFYVHSQNPVGAVNIRRYLNNYLEFKKRESQKTD